MGDSQSSSTGTDSVGPCPTCPSGKCPKNPVTARYPEPPSSQIDAAVKAVPEGFTHVLIQDTNGRFEADGDGLARWLCRRGHGPAAAEWAILRLIADGKVTVHFRPIAVPIFHSEDGTRWPGNLDVRARLPPNVPVYLDQILVRAEPPLWKSWRKKSAKVRQLAGQHGKRNDSGMKSVIVAALNSHHQYADKSCLETEPISLTQLARNAAVSKASVSRFFSTELGERAHDRGRKSGGYRKYKVLCRDSRRLLDWLQKLNDERPVRRSSDDTDRD